MEPKVQNLGWANNWKETPAVVVTCRGLGHKPTSRDIGQPRNRGLDTEYRCDLCGYVYHVDSSD